MNIITKLLTLIILVSLSITELSAQDRENRNKERREYYKTLKIAFFTEEMEFTTQEAEKFWPFYNAYQRKRDELHDKQRNSYRKLRDESDNLSEEEALELSDLYIEILKQETQLDIEFHNQMLDILPASKVMKLYLTEIRFREHMLRRIRDERRQDDDNRDIPQP